MIVPVRAVVVLLCLFSAAVDLDFSHWISGAWSSLTLEHQTCKALVLVEIRLQGWGTFHLLINTCPLEGGFHCDLITIALIWVQSHIYTKTWFSQPGLSLNVAQSCTMCFWSRALRGVISSLSPPAPSCSKARESHISQNETGQPKPDVPPGLLIETNPSAGARAAISVGCGQSWGSTSSTTS